MKTAENRRGDDAVAVANPMARRHRREVGRIRNTGPEARVWTPTIVVRDPVPKDAAKVTLVEGHHPVQAFAANCADHTFAEGIGVSSRLHRQRAVRHKPSASPILSIRCVAGRFG